MKRVNLRITLLVFTVLVFAVDAYAQTTEITYQGQLQSSSMPASGSFDFEFVLYDGGGSQIGPVLSRSGVAVANGIFSVNLDFQSSFTGPNRFLEIRVRQSGGGAFTTLTPRQPVTSAPYSIKSLTAETATTADTAATATNATNAVTAANFTGSLSGDVTGTQSSTTVARIQSRNVANTPPLDGQVLKYNGAANQWVPGTDNIGSAGGGGTITGVTPGTGLTGGGSSGNVSLSIANSGVGSSQLAEGSVTSSKIPVGQVVKTVNGLSDSLTLAAGLNISITPAGNTLTIASTGGGGCPSPCTAAIFNATQQYNIAGTRVLSIAAGDSLFAGYQAGQSNTTGNRNTFVGPGAGLFNTSGKDNSFFGSSAGASNTTGNHNAFFGVGAGFDNGGSNNSFFGGSTGANNRSGAENSYFGAEAGRVNQTGSRNSFFGYSAGTSGSGELFSDNSFFGHNAGRTTTGLGNSFFGSGAGAQTSSGFSNVIVGSQAGSENNLGAGNVFIGARAGLRAGGSGNILIGNEAGADTAGAQNIMIGSGAGRANVSGIKNMAFGFQSNFGSPNLENAIAIGADSIVTQSNSLILGSVAGASPGATSTVSVGIGTTAPLARLDVAATGNGAELIRFSTERPWAFRQVRTGSVTGLQLFSTSGQKYFEITSSDGTNVASFLADSTSSKVGIGTTNPIATLDVAGSLKLDILGGGGGVPLCRAFNNFIVSCNSSSARYKTNVASFSSGLSIIDLLRPVSYNWKEGGASDVGFIAEEVADAEPQLATYNEKGEVEGVKYDRLSVLFVNAFKEQQKIIENQQQQLDQLKRIVCSGRKLSAACKGVR